MSIKSIYAFFLTVKWIVATKLHKYLRLSHSFTYMEILEL